MALTDIQIRSAKPGIRLAKLSDGNGLQLWITPEGKKYWRLAYRFAGVQKSHAIGVYPAISLREAQARVNCEMFWPRGKTQDLQRSSRRRPTSLNLRTLLV